MNILFWGLTLSLIGKVLLALGVLLAHHKIAHEHRIDRKVLRTFRTEFVITLIGLFLILMGYGLELYFYHFANLLTCHGTDCTPYLEALFGN
ncbi:MAG: hypothetical protein WDZ93_03385 [Candidatus Paceibacterota bacterium]